MIALLGLFDWIGQIGDVILYGLIAVIVIACIVMMCKYEGSRKFLGYALAVIICATGVYSGFGLYDEFTSKSYINGSFEHLNQQTVKSYSYNSTAMVFYPDTNNNTKYIFTAETEKVEDFDATKNSYLVKFNDYELMDQTSYTAGSVYVVVPLEFYATSGELVCDTELYISVKFLSNATSLEVWCFGNSDYQYITQYINDFGFRLSIEKLL